MNKKLLVSLAGLSLLLTGCNEIIAEPKDLTDSVLVDDLSNIVNNTLEKVYHNYHDSVDFRTHVLDEVLLAIAEHKITPYVDLKDSADADDVLLKAKIDKRMKHKFYNDLVSGSYTYRSVFDERKFVVQKIYGADNSYIVDGAGNPVSINDVLGAAYSADDAFYNKGMFLPMIDKDNYDDAQYEIVHFDYYTDYLEETYVETVYRELLVEKYVEAEQSSTLGRNYAREIEYVAIQNNSEHPTAASALVNAFVDEHILGPKSANLEILANAWRGVDILADSDEKALLLQSKVLVEGEGEEKDYDHTLFGDVESDFKLIDNNPNKTDTSIENRFTGGGAYPKDIGKEIEKNEIRLKDFVVRDWGIKNGGFGSLPEDIRTRLFNIGVANSVDYVVDDLGVLANAGNWEDPTRIASTFVRNIGGEYYLVPKTYEKGNNRNFVFFQNNTYYIIKVKEAVNTAKLTEEDPESYQNLGRSEAEVVEIQDEIAFRLAQLESTKSNALNFYMDEITVVFHDESVRDHFIAQYPDVFGEDD